MEEEKETKVETVELPDTEHHEKELPEKKRMSYLEQFDAINKKPEITAEEEAKLKKKQRRDKIFAYISDGLRALAGTTRNKSARQAVDDKYRKIYETYKEDVKDYYVNRVKAQQMDDKIEGLRNKERYNEEKLKLDRLRIENAAKEKEETRKQKAEDAENKNKQQDFENKLKLRRENRLSKSQSGKPKTTKTTYNVGGKDYTDLYDAYENLPDEYKAKPRYGVPLTQHDMRRSLAKYKADTQKDEDYEQYLVEDEDYEQYLVEE